MKKNIKRLFFFLLAKSINSFNMVFLSEKFFFLDFKKNKYNIFLQFHCNNHFYFDANLGMIYFFDNKFIEISLSAKKKNFFYFIGIKHNCYLFKIGFVNKSFSLSFSYLYKCFESEITLYYKSCNKKIKDIKESKNLKDNISKVKKLNNILPNDLLFENYSVHSETDDFLYNQHYKGLASLNLYEKNNNVSKRSNKNFFTKQRVSPNRFDKKFFNQKSEKTNFILNNYISKDSFLLSILQLEMRIRKMSSNDIQSHKKKFYDLNNFISSQYLELNKYDLQEQEQKLNGRQSFLSSLRCENFKKNNIKKDENSFIYIYMNKDGKEINSLQYKSFLEDINIIDYYRKEHQNQKISLFLSVADKLKFEPYSYYENKHQFAFDLYAFEIFSLMKTTLEQNGKKLGTILNENKNIENINSIYKLQDLNFNKFYNQLSEVAKNDKLAKLWLNEFNQCLKEIKKTSEASLMSFYKKVLEKCKIFLILKCLIDSQQGKKASINFELNQEIIASILNFDLDCLTVCSFQDDLYQKFKQEIDANKFLVNKKKFKNDFLKKKNLNPRDKLITKLEEELNLDFKRHLKSNAVKTFNKSKDFFNKMQLYLATYNLLTQKKSNYIKESLQKKVDYKQNIKDNEQIKINVKKNNAILEKFLNGLKDDISSKFDRDLPVDNYYETVFYRSNFIKSGLDKIHFGCQYEGFEMEDFLINCLEKDGYFSNNFNQYFTYDLDFFSSNFSFQKIYYESIKKIETFRFKFMGSYNDDYLQKMKGIIKKTKKTLDTELKNKQNLFKNNNITAYAYFQNFDHILYKIHLIEKILNNKNQYIDYKILINDIIIYPNLLNFVSDWSFLIKKNKKKELSYKHNMLMNIDQKIFKNNKCISDNVMASQRTFLFSLSVLDNHFLSFDSYKKSNAFFNQNLIYLFEGYKYLLSSENQTNLIRSITSNFNSSTMPAIDCLKFLIQNFSGNKDELLQLIIISKLCHIPVENIQKIYSLMKEYGVLNLNDISKMAVFMQSEVVTIKENFINNINLYIKDNRSYTFDEIKSKLDKIEKNLQSRAFFEVFIPLSNLLKNFQKKVKLDSNLIEMFINVVNKHKYDESWEKLVFYDKKTHDFFKYIRSYINSNSIKKIF